MAGGQVIRVPLFYTTLWQTWSTLERAIQSRVQLIYRQFDSIEFFARKQTHTLS